MTELSLHGTCSPSHGELLRFRVGVELRGGVNPLKDRLKIDNYMTRAMQDVMKLVRVSSNRHLRNWEAPTPLCRKSSPWRAKRAVG